VNITKFEDRTIIQSSPNNFFLDSLKKEVKSPFSLPLSKSGIHIGMEFEFFVPTSNRTANERIDDLNEKVEHLIRSFSFYNDTIEVLPDSYEFEKNLSHAYLEKDSTLHSENGEGFEFVSPMICLDETAFYLKTTSEAIRDIGYSNDGCGLHFHISSEKLGDIDMAKLMTFLHHEEGLFDGYIDRNQYVKSLERVFLNMNIERFNDDIREQTKQYDIVFLTDNHIELRIFGGEDVYDSPDDILKRLDKFLNIYRIACTPELEQDLYKQLVEENIKNGHHQLEPANFETVCGIAKELSEKYDWNLGEAFEEAFNISEESVLTPEKLINEFDKQYEEETLRTI